MLIFGETGSGKSTLINTLTNHLRSGSLSELKVSIPTMYLRSTEEFSHSEFDLSTNSKSQTKEPIEYVFNKDGEQICILDTPGLCDTEGLEKDDENLDKIIKSAIAIEKLSGIILVMNGTNSRVNNNIKHVLNKFNGFFPDSIMKNIIVVFTCCREETCNFKSLDKLDIKPRKIIYMNNSAFSVDPRKYNLNLDQILQLEWAKSMEQSKNIIDEMKKLSATSTFEFSQMLKIRNSIKSKLHDSKMKIMELQKIQDEYTHAKNLADIHGATSEQFKNYTVQKIVPKEVFFETNYHSTICGKCSKVCHSQCGLDEIPGKTHGGIENCACFCYSDNKCSVCGCDPSTHYHERKDSKLQMVTLDEELTDIKNKYLAEMQQKDEATKKMSDHDLVIKGIESSIEQLKKDITKDVKELKKICKKYNLVNELTDTILQMEQEKLLLKTIESQKTAQEFINMLKYLANNFSSL